MTRLSQRQEQDHPVLYAGLQHRCRALGLVQTFTERSATLRPFRQPCDPAR